MKFDISAIGDWCGSLSLFAWIVYIVFKCWVKESLKSKFAQELQILKNENQQELKNIEARNQKELEGFKLGYKKVLDENRIRFSQWHDAQAKAIKKMYAKLAELKNALQCMVNPCKFFTAEINIQEELKKEEKRFMDAYIDSHSFFESNKILFYENHISTLNDLYEKVISAIRSHGMSKNNSRASTKSLQLAENADRIAKSLDVILDDLRKDFRTILEGKSEEPDVGVERTENSTLENKGNVS